MTGGHNRWHWLAEDWKWLFGEVARWGVGREENTTLNGGRGPGQVAGRR